MKARFLPLLALALPGAVHADINVGVTLSATGPAASLGIPEKNTFEMLPMSIAGEKINGRLWIGIMPNAHSNLIGLSKYWRLAEWIMGRPQIQEEAIAQMADLLMNKVSPDGLAVFMEADHFCMHWRGVKDDGTKMVNSVMRGSFLKDATLRREFLSLLNLTD